MPIDSEWGILYSDVASDFYSAVCMKRFTSSKVFKKCHFVGPFLSFRQTKRAKNGTLFQYFEWAYLFTHMPE